MVRRLKDWRRYKLPTEASKRRRTPAEAKWYRQRKKWCVSADKLWRHPEKIDHEIFLMMTSALGEPWLSTSVAFLESPGTQRMYLLQLIEYTKHVLKLEEEERIGIDQWIQGERLNALTKFYAEERRRGREWGRFFGMTLERQP